MSQQTGPLVAYQRSLISQLAYRQLQTRRGALAGYRVFVSPEFASWTARRPLIPKAEGMDSTIMATESFVAGGRLRQMPPLLHAGER